MVKKYLKSDRFGFLIELFLSCFDNSVRNVLYYLVEKKSVILISPSCFNP